MELTKEDKLTIVNDEIRQQTGLHYRLQLRARGHKAADNQRGLDEVSNALAAVEAQLDELRAELEMLQSQAE